MISVHFRIALFTCIFFYLEVFARKYYNTYSIQQTKYTKYTTYSPQVIDKTCLLKPDPGPCRAEIPMYYFDPKEGNCTEFRWGGCQGNGNRFDTRKQCLNSCLSKPGDPKTRPKWCRLTFDYGFCFGDLKRWYYDHVWKVCKETIYSGCGGNKNNFYSLEQCDSVCRFGNGRLQLPSNQDGSKQKKILIINPRGAPSSRGKVQITTSTVTSTAPK